MHGYNTYQTRSEEKKRINRLEQRRIDQHDVENGIESTTTYNLKSSSGTEKSNKKNKNREKRVKRRIAFSNYTLMNDYPEKMAYSGTYGIVLMLKPKWVTEKDWSYYAKWLELEYRFPPITSFEAFKALDKHLPGENYFIVRVTLAAHESTPLIVPEKLNKTDVNSTSDERIIDESLPTNDFETENEGKEAIIEAGLSDDRPESDTLQELASTSDVTTSTEDKEKNESKIESSPKDDARIVYEKSDDNKHQFNNTGYIFRRANGEPITDASEVRKFIKQQKQSDDPEISKQFKEDFPVAQKGTSKGFNAPTLEIEGYKYKYYSMLGDPSWGKEENESVTDKPTEDTDFIGSYVDNKPVKVNVPNGIILHETPDSNDPLYNQIKRSDFKDEFLLKKGSKLEIIAKSNKDNPGWVMVRDENSRIGWIEERYLTETKPTDVLAQFTGKSYLVKKDEGLSEVLLNQLSAQDLAGEDIRDYALAFYLLNRDKVIFTSYMTSMYEEDKNNYFDPDKADARILFKSIKLIEGSSVRIPTKAFLAKAKADGLIKSRSEEQQMFLDFANYGAAFLEGIYDGLVTSAQDFAEGIWEIVKGIFTGEILEQFKQMWEAIKEMVSDPSKIVDAFSGLIDDFEKKWNNPNQLEAWHFRGEVTGQILFEIVMALIGIGAANLLNKLKKIGKLGKMVATMESKVSKVKKAVTPKLPTKRPPTNKKGNLTYSPVKDSDETLKEAFDRKKKNFEDQFEKDLLDETSDLIKDRAAAYLKYKAKGGKMSQAKWEIKYNTLYKNRKIGKIGEDTFKDFMDGYKPPKSYKSTDGKDRYIDNFKPNTKTAREIKTGKVNDTKSIREQIEKDLEILANKDITEIQKIEWHFLDGLDPKLEERLIEIKNIIGSDKFDYIDYTKNK